ncbi:UNVERIFIED_CONTAM: Malonyl-coenzyme:anthocyanin 5-O-glucoside-6'''-O-malonyltransferase, partial [Sesamum latifolium]
SLTIAVSGSDFDHLIGNHAQDADQFYEFVPEIDPVTDESEYQRVPVMALKVTLFPGRGICVGFANLHCLGDASSVVGFIQAWAAISKLGGDEEGFLTKHAESLPILDRSADIKKLKDLVLAKKPGLLQVSSFVVTTSYVWTCFVKSEEQVDDDDVLEFLIFAADIRARIDPPVPANYFGNCLGYGAAKIQHKQLVGGEGFVIAAEAIADQIKNRVNNKEQVLKGAENWLSDIKKMFAIRAIGVSGSPKFDLSSADFGWGRARKLEVVSIDGEKHSMSLCKSRDSEGGLEVGLSLPKARMEAFAAIFEEGLRF